MNLAISSHCNNMRSFVLVLTLVAVSCGRKLNDHRFANPGLDWKVVGGLPAEDGQFPFIVSMRAPNGVHTCGGSIISSTFVLSAAHCVYGFSGRTLVSGTHTLSSGGTVHTIARIILNGYVPDTVENDVTLLQVSNEFVFGPNVATISFSAQIVNEPLGVTLAGWGTTTYPGTMPDRLQFLPTLETISNEQCQLTWGEFVFDSSICTAGRAGFGTCHGDSGGPLVNTATGELVGVVSWGAPCAAGWPDVYARVSFYAGWIRATLES